MSQQTINIGVNPGDGSGDPLRVSFIKINGNFTELYSLIGNLTASIASLTAQVSALAVEQFGIDYGTIIGIVTADIDYGTVDVLATSVVDYGSI